MKKYQLTKITVKTREVVFLSRDTNDETQNAVCPVCHAPLSAKIPLAEKSAGAANIRQPPGELPPATGSDDQDKK
jgi:hypothetical protein